MTKISNSKVKLLKKGEISRERIYQTAVVAFMDKDPETATLREIAKQAGISLGLFYRYFSSKDEIILEYYQRSMVKFLETMEAVPPGKLGPRFVKLMHQKILSHQEDRAFIVHIMSIVMKPKGPVSIFSKESKEIRETVLQGIRAFVAQSKDCPNNTQMKEDISQLFFALHFIILLYWTHDQSKGSQSTEKVILLFEKLIKAILWALKIPTGRSTLHLGMELFTGLFQEGKDACAPKKTEDFGTSLRAPCVLEDLQKSSLL